MQFDDAAEREEFRQTAAKLLFMAESAWPPAQVAVFKQWLDDLDGWVGGAPPLSPGAWSGDSRFK